MQGPASTADELLQIHEAGLAATSGRNQKVEFRLCYLKFSLAHVATVLGEARIGVPKPELGNARPKPT